MNVVIVWLGPEVLLSLLPTINLTLYVDFYRNQSWSPPRHAVSIRLHQRSFKVEPAHLQDRLDT